MIIDLKGRLKLIADKIPVCNVVADIGTDHAYLPVYLIQNGRCQRSIASDVKPGPVQVANRNIAKYKLSDKIETRMGSGLDTLESSEADAVIIAGMGGTLLAELLEAGVQKASNADVLVLQPMNDLDIVRKWLYDHCFEIFDEELSAEGNKIYCVISARYTGQNKSYMDFELHVGECLLKKQDPLLLSYCEMKVKQIDRVLGQLKDMADNSRLLNYYTSLKNDYIMLITQLKDLKS